MSLRKLFTSCDFIPVFIHPFIFLTPLATQKQNPNQCVGEQVGFQSTHLLEEQRSRMPVRKEATKFCLNFQKTSQITISVHVFRTEVVQGFFPWSYERQLVRESKWNPCRLVRAAHWGSRPLCPNKRPQRPNVWIGYDQISLGFYRGQVHLFVSLSHLKVAIVVFVKKFTSTKEAKCSASLAFWILKLRKPFTFKSALPLTTVRIQPDSDSWLDYVWACLCNLP